MLVFMKNEFITRNWSFACTSKKPLLSWAEQPSRVIVYCCYLLTFSSICTELMIRAK